MKMMIPLVGALFVLGALPALAVETQPVLPAEIEEYMAQAHARAVAALNGEARTQVLGDQFPLAGDVWFYEENTVDCKTTVSNSYLTPTRPGPVLQPHDALWVYRGSLGTGQSTHSIGANGYGEAVSWTQTGGAGDEFILYNQAVKWSGSISTAGYQYCRAIGGGFFAHFQAINGILEAA